MASTLQFDEKARHLGGYARTGAAQTRFGRIETGFRGEHDMTVRGEGVPTVHVDDVLNPDTRARILRRPGVITVDGTAGTLTQSRGLRLTRKGMTVTAEVAGRTYRLRMEGISRFTVRRDGHGRTGWTGWGGRLRVEDRADPTDLAVTVALTNVIDKDSLSMLPGG